MKVESNIFHTDPFLGCPFDNSEMELVAEWRGFQIGMIVGFEGPGSWSRIQGEILAIGQGAKYLNGAPFTAFAIKLDDARMCIKTHTEIHHVI